MIRYPLFLPLFLLAVTALPNSVTGYEPPEDLYQYLATVRRVIDGNTISADVDLGFGVWMHKTEVRLKGVKTPTIAEDTTRGVAAHKFLDQALKDQERILIRTYYDPTGEYDGWYARVSIWDEDKEEWISVNQIVLDSGHGSAVDEGAK